MKQTPWSRAPLALLVLAVGVLALWVLTRGLGPGLEMGDFGPQLIDGVIDGQAFRGSFDLAELADLPRLLLAGGGVLVTLLAVLALVVVVLVVVALPMALLAGLALLLALALALALALVLVLVLVLVLGIVLAAVGGPLLAGVLVLGLLLLPLLLLAKLLGWLLR